MVDGASTTQSQQHKTGTSAKPAVASTKKTDNFVDKVLACRYEMKYVVTDSKAAAMAQYIGQHIPMDRYCKLQKGGVYPIVSLYIDSPEFRLCRESITGMKNRFKLRIRSYTDEPDYPRFFEIKRRINTVIVKSRARVMDRDVEPLLYGASLPAGDYKTDEAALNQFQLYTKNINAGPAVLIRYWRKAWEGEGEGRVRVTFDTDLCYCVTKEPVVRLGGTGWQNNNVTWGHAILEIKFTGRYPAWLNRMVRCFGLETQSMSKYATSILQSCEKQYCGPYLTELDYG